VGDGVRGNVRGCAGLILDENVLPELLVEMFADDPRNGIGKPTGGKADNECDPLAGIVSRV
jgi:hypothetical protein